MDYLAYLFLNHLCSVTEDIRYVDGKEQVCLVIPTQINQLKRGKRGNWILTVHLDECLQNAAQRTHKVELAYLNNEEVAKAKQAGRFERTQRLGNVYEKIKNVKKINRYNGASDITCDGTIALSDIPEEKIIDNRQNGKKYLHDVVLKKPDTRNIIYTGFVCIDDIPRHLIRTDDSTGKKLVRCRFQKMPLLDTYMNTHQLVVHMDDGSEIEIGRFKEWVKSEQSTEERKIENASTNEEHTTTVNPRPPQSIDGIRF